MKVDENDLNRLIAGQRKNISVYITFSAGLVLLGISLIFVFHQTDTFVKIGGGFVSCLSAFPLNEVIKRFEKINAFENLGNKLTLLKRENTDESRQALAEVQAVIWEAIKKMALA
jgi:hypothetical protein